MRSSDVLRVVLLLALHAGPLRIGAVDAHDPDVYDAPEPDVEPSDLETHESQTHAEGKQYDFVRDEKASAGDGAGSGGSGGGGGGIPPPAIESLIRQLMADGVLGGADPNVRIVNSQGGGFSDAIKALKAMTDSLPPTAPSGGGKRARRGGATVPERHSTLPAIEPGTPISQMLQQMRASLTEATVAHHHRKASSASHDGVGGGGGGGDAYIDHLDERGLALLEADLRQRLARVVRRRQHLSRLGSHEGDDEEEDEDTEDEEDTEDDDIAGRAASTSATAFASSSMATAAASGFTDLERAIDRLLGAARARGAGDDSAGDDETDSYESRLAAEANLRGTPGEQRSRGLGEMLTRMLGGDSDSDSDSDEYALKVVMGDADGEEHVVEFSLDSSLFDAIRGRAMGAASSDASNGHEAEDEDT